MKPKDAFIGYPKNGNAARRVGPSAFPLMTVTPNVSSWLTTDSPAMLPVRPLYPQKQTFP